MNIRLIAASVTALLLLGGVFFLQGSSRVTADEGAVAPPPIEKQLQDGGPDKWKAALKENDEEREAIIKFLMERVKDEKEAFDNRELAAGLLAHMGSRDAIDFFFQNIEMEAHGGGNGWREQLCRRALVDVTPSWEKVPAFLDYIKEKHSDRELSAASWAVYHAPGFALMVPLLEGVYLNPANDTHKANLRLCIDYMIPDMRTRDLTPAQQERRKLLQDKKIKPGQITDEAPQESNAEPGGGTAPPTEGGTNPPASGGGTP